MEKENRKTEKFTQSITFKAIMVCILTLILLIPSVMIQNLISERQYRSETTIEKINAKWSNSQVVCGPMLTIPYEITRTEEKKVTTEKHFLFITPETLHIDTKLQPEERYYGIYKAILYKSQINISGEFDKVSFAENSTTKILWNEAYMNIGISDLRGVTSNIDFTINGQPLKVEASGSSDSFLGTKLILHIENTDIFNAPTIAFNCTLHLNGSSSLGFIPVGKTTKVTIAGDWKAPGFYGNFSPEHTINDNDFKANWNILHFNRNIPEYWNDNTSVYLDDLSFGVNLIDTVNHYQQNMRSAKYALMFIALTFVVFFFVEILTKKRIHPVQYLLVGIALILFYSLLLSISEQLNFAIAYLIASFATITLITVYAHSIFKNKTQTGILTLILCILYVFLYVVLQLEDVALLIGSIGLFVILGIIMYFSRKINFYKPELNPTLGQEEVENK